MTSAYPPIVAPPILVPPILAAPPLPRKPRVWPVYANMAIAFAVFFGLQIVLVAILVAVFLVRTGVRANSPEFKAYVQDLIVNPWLLIVSALITQATMLAAALLPAALSRQKFLPRLGLNKPTGGPLLLIWIILAALSVSPLFECVTKLFEMNHMPLPTQHLEEIQKSISNASGLGSVLLFISIVIFAPIVEELLCRGYIQSRLQLRHGPLLAILIASAYFAFLHLDLLHSTFAFILGLYLAITAWRSGSILPGIAIHFLNNLCSMVDPTFGWARVTSTSVYFILPLALALLASGLIALFFVRPPPSLSHK